ncbi:HAMP domain-containing sensor histidine kinase [Flavobacterium sp. DG1-102-2]|uniref:sensor histidine kinase n=1 Tax=Flavobacterium sp. DG1-102-2 TaxID=3081663 RepID=UPI002949EBD8|nr:HAMP domain-containing sensor histidine kinase [Flavobacterium sp. DG1-102-2]MDV6167976.1 HAMP domain-containing sensor histidine kinase [Flavobacterium sp. DG1-102-2]
MKLRNYTLRYLIIALLGVIAIWAGLFYAVILDEVYDNIDDGLKNSKILIIREAYANEKVLETKEFGINQYKMTPLPKGTLYDFSDKFISTFEFMEYDDDNEPVRLLETVFNDKNGNPYKLTIRASMVEEDELLEDLLTALVALYIMLVISIAIINQIILRKAWKSFYEMLNGLKNFRLGTGNSFTAPHSPISEFKALGTELEDLLKRNEAIYASQKHFIENASHELQTPLAISLNKLELFAENNTLPEDQMMELGRISDTLNRLVRLNKSLLMLSKIENRQYADEEKVNFNALAEQLVEDYQDLTEYKDIKLNINTQEQLTFSMNKGLALTLISNLLKNAIVHNHNGGTVNIILDTRSLTISNSGSSQSLDKEAVFKRFYRDTTNEQSTGLGLSIVNSIIINYRLTVDYSFNGLHTFTVTFPETA